MFLVAHSFPWATLWENCLLLGTENVADKYPSIYSRQMEAIVFIYEIDKKKKKEGERYIFKVFFDWF